MDDAGSLYVIDDDRNGLSAEAPALAIRKIGVDGTVETLYPDAAPSLGGTLAYPAGIAVSRSGSVYLSNTGRDQIVMLTDAGELRASSARASRSNSMLRCGASGLGVRQFSAVGVDWHASMP